MPGPLTERSMKAARDESNCSDTQKMTHYHFNDDDDGDDDDDDDVDGDDDGSLWTKERCRLQHSSWLRRSTVR